MDSLGLARTHKLWHGQRSGLPEVRLSGWGLSQNKGQLPPCCGLIGVVDLERLSLESRSEQLSFGIGFGAKPIFVMGIQIAQNYDAFAFRHGNSRYEGEELV